MIFLTVGTQFPFDRLVKAVDDILGEGLIHEEIFGQIGTSSYEPRNFKSVNFLEKREFDIHLKKASGLIGHAGMGTIEMALYNNKPLLVMPRLSRYREVVHDHQLEIARRFEELGHVLVAYQKEDLAIKIMDLRHFIPRRRETQVAEVVQRISFYLHHMSGDNVNMDFKKIQ